MYFPSLKSENYVVWYPTYVWFDKFNFYIVLVLPYLNIVVFTGNKIIYKKKKTENVSFILVFSSIQCGSGMQGPSGVEWTTEPSTYIKKPQCTKTKCVENNN